jgi:anti-sigma28 factor (negative regulator of flagellin synthesis)
MSSINHLGNVGGAGPVQRVVTNPVQKQIPTDAPAQLPATDRLELSGVSHLLKTLKSNDVRMDKVAIVKAQIEAGTYDDEKKLDAAVDKLLDDLLK